MSDIQKTFDLQKNHVLELRQKPVEYRLEMLKKLQQSIIAHEKEICEAIQKDFHKAPAESVITEIVPVLLSIKHVLAHLKKWAKPHKKSGSMLFLGTNAYVQYEAKGVCLIIAPWNYPFQLLFSPLVYALAAGNTAILKPSEITPHTSALMEKMINQTFEPEQVAIFQGDATTAQQLLELPFDHIFFTGSPAIGKVIMRAAAQHLTSVTLELGGKSPVIIDQTANIKDTAQKIVWAKFINAGQTCVAPDYVLVHESQQKVFLDAAQHFIEQSYGKNPENSPAYAHIVNDKHFERLRLLLEDALEKGAKVATGGKFILQDRCIVPTLLTDVPLESKIMDEEIFGAILPVLTYQDLEECLKIINDKPKPLALYVFSEDDKNIEKILKNTSAGGTCIRDAMVHLAHPELPFGGVNNSGIGKTHGFYGFEAFSNTRAVLEQRTGMTSAKLLYPPYNQKVESLTQLIKRFFT